MSIDPMSQPIRCGFRSSPAENAGVGTPYPSCPEAPRIRIGSEPFALEKWSNIRADAVIFQASGAACAVRTIDVTVAGVTRHDLARHHDLDRTAERVVDHRDRVDCHAVKWRDLLSNERFRLRRPLIIRVTAEDDIQGDATRASVLAAHYLREVLKLHGLFV